MPTPRKFPIGLPELTDERLTGAACAGMAPLFDADPLPGEGQEHVEDRTHRAARICAGCSVRSVCETVAAELGAEAVGVWGGAMRAGAKKEQR